MYIWSPLKRCARSSRVELALAQSRQKKEMQRQDRKVWRVADLELEQLRFLLLLLPSRFLDHDGRHQPPYRSHTRTCTQKEKRIQTHILDQVYAGAAHRPNAGTAQGAQGNAKHTAHLLPRTARWWLHQRKKNATYSPAAIATRAQSSKCVGHSASIACGRFLSGV